MKIVVGISLGVLLALLLAGCYTVLVHPRTEVTRDYHHEPRHCSDCHSSADYYYWHYPNYYNRYRRYSYWRPYYCDPWWWDDYWYWDDYEGGRPVETGERHFWQPTRRPSSGPGLVPDTGEQKRKEDKAPPPDTDVRTDEGKSQKEKTSGRHFWQRPSRPSRPQDQPEQPEPKQEAEKAEESK